jgi:hypothetical protein
MPQFVLYELSSQQLIIINITLFKLRLMLRFMRCLSLWLNFSVVELIRVPATVTTARPLF